MTKQVLIIYVLIMLECRLSLDEASKIFQIKKEKLEEVITNPFIVGEIYAKAIKYLIYSECFRTPKLDNKKGIFKAEALAKRLKLILAIEDKDKQEELLRSFNQELEGFQKVLEITNKNGLVNKEDRKVLLKFKLKYGLSNRFFTFFTGMDAKKTQNWEEELDDEYLKRRLEYLRDHGKDVAPFALKLKRENKLWKFLK